MSERQIAERHDGLSKALGRLSEVRSRRTGAMPAAFERASDILADAPAHGSVFGFADRARSALIDPLED